MKLKYKVDNIYQEVEVPLLYALEVLDKGDLINLLFKDNRISYLYKELETNKKLKDKVYKHFTYMIKEKHRKVEW